MKEEVIATETACKGDKVEAINAYGAVAYFTITAEIFIDNNKIVT